jgi:hypothetical protein
MERIVRSRAKLVLAFEVEKLLIPEAVDGFSRSVTRQRVSVVMKSVP